ncbi:MAG: hypothetical protein HWE16_05345 [Gammaproteobacteria bacterium]|nr:hypothetical protein [Gammaproteobacteria bacterium]
MDLKRTLKITAPIAIVVGLIFYSLGLWHSKSSLSLENSQVTLDKTVSTNTSDKSSNKPETLELNSIETQTEVQAEDPKLKQLEDYNQRMAFRAQIQAFAQTITERSQAENIELYQALQPKILQFEQDLHMSRGESYYLQASLLSKIYDGDIYLEEQLTKLAEQYPQQKPNKDHLDDKFYQYKAEEQRILEQAMAMDTFPDGLTREAYLRKLLLEARQKIYK